MTFQPSAFYAVLGCFAPCFSQPSFQNFVAISIGWVLARDRHTVSGALRVGTSLGAAKHFSVLSACSGRPETVLLHVVSGERKTRSGRRKSQVPGPLVPAQAGALLRRHTGRPAPRSDSLHGILHAP